jgi:hypothetical protein
VGEGAGLPTDLSAEAASAKAEAIAKVGGDVDNFSNLMIKKVVIRVVISGKPVPFICC